MNNNKEERLHWEAAKVISDLLEGYVPRKEYDDLKAKYDIIKWSHDILAHASVEAY